MRIGNRESGSANWFFVPFLNKLATGNLEPGTTYLFLISVYNTEVSKVQIGNKDPVPGSFLTILGFVLI